MKEKIKLILAGIICGAVNGFFGGGGGLICVPALAAFLRLSQKSAHATAILIILPVCLLSAAVYLYSLKPDFSLLVPCAIGVLSGGIVGAKLLNKLSTPFISLLFALVMLFAGIWSALK